MVTMAQRIAELRGERGLSAPALSAALGFPRTAIDKFESGRQTPTQDQQSRMATYFGVTLAYLRGESGDRTETEDWMAGGIPDPEPVPMPRAARPSKPAKPSGEPGAVFGESFVCGGGSDSTVSFQAAQNSRILLLGFHKVLPDDPLGVEQKKVRAGPHLTKKAALVGRPFCVSVRQVQLRSVVL